MPLNPESRFPIPVVILARPQLGENIGAVARAMSNFGLKELRLVAPRDGWPNRKALEMAAGGTSIIEAAKVFPNFVSATADIQRAYATTARPRDMVKRVLTPDEAVKEILNPVRGAAEAQDRVALIFGPERTGLENEEIVWCDALITISTAPENPSLNLAQSAVIVGYEWWKVFHPVRAEGEAQGLAPAPALRLRRSQDHSATKSDWQGLFEQLASYLNEVNYYRVAHKKPLMWQNLQNMLTRGQWGSQEVRSFRGMLRALWEKRTPGS